MPFPKPFCDECSNNINIIKWREPHIVDHVGNNSFLRAYKIILLAYWHGLITGVLSTFFYVDNSFGVPAIFEDPQIRS